jgi:hypothetical protein
VIAAEPPNGDAPRDVEELHDRQLSRVDGNQISGSSVHADDGGWAAVVAGDLRVDELHVGAHKGAPTVQEVSERELTQMYEYVVETKSQEELTAELTKRSLVVLRGPVAGGQNVTALLALRDSGWRRHLARLLTADPKDVRLESEVACVLDARWEAWADVAAKRARFEERMAHLAEQVRTWNTRLVVLLPTNSHPVDAPIEHHPPLLDDVFERRFAWKTGGDTSKRDDAVNRELRACRTPREAADLADLLAVGLKEGRETDDIFAGRSARLREELRARLSQKKSRMGRCFMIAAAVLEGRPVETVSQAAINLAKKVDEELDQRTNSDQPREDREWEQLSQWANLAAADIVPAPGPDGGRIVRMRPEAPSHLVLQVVWEELATLRRPLVEWLRELTEDHDQSQHAAEAIGRIGGQDFAAIERDFLDDWASSKSARRHDLAAHALKVAANHSNGLTRIVLGRLREWARGNRNRRLIVIQTYGSELGLTKPSMPSRAWYAPPRTGKCQRR